MLSGSRSVSTTLFMSGFLRLLRFQAPGMPGRKNRGIILGELARRGRCFIVGTEEREQG